jgi:16S rRNA (cytosine967-C5)-methyltransferase
VTGPREVARRVLERVDKGAWATLALAAELDRSGLAQRDRRLATELVYGVLRHRTRIDRALSQHCDLRKTPAKVKDILRLAAYQLLLLRVANYAAVDEAVAAVKGLAGARLAGFANAVLRKVAQQGEPRFPGDERLRLEVEASMPRWIIDEMAQVLAPEELSAAVLAFAQPARLAVRANRLRIQREALLEVLRGEDRAPEPLADLPDAILLDGGEPGASPSFAQGLWSVQDSSAQRALLLAAPEPGWRVLDACAGVGGKSGYVAELMGNRGAIDAADLSGTKLELLEQSSRRMGHSIVSARRCDLLDEEAGLAVDYDLVVLDAPCTGLGVLRRHPEAKWRLQPGDVARMAEAQRQLLARLARRVRPGGTLLYAVCSFSRAEGEGQVAGFLAAHPEFSLEEQLAMWPHRDGGDGFFAARLRRAP